MGLRRVIREPLLHFFLLGAALFVVFGWLNRGAMDAPDEVVVDQARIVALVAQFERVWQRSPTAPEIDGLVESWIREEIMYREGVALGLDVNDSIVRRRVAQKMIFIADGVAPEPPSEADLAGWLEANADAYRIEPVYSFRQVYFDPAKHDDDLRARMIELAALPSTPEGDATLLPAELQSVRESSVSRAFGSDFAGALDQLPPGEWQGPVESAYGLH
ncbi:MAG: peptidyl-prolyl cis-trans isomerase, partial [Woeseiaceae bacterium]